MPGRPVALIVASLGVALAAWGSPAAPIVSADFDNGTPGPFSVIGQASFPDDPSGTGHGRVAQLRYADTTFPVEIRSALVYHPKPGMGLGSTLFFSGDLYLPDGTFNLGNLNIDRKLVTFRAAPTVADTTQPDLTVVVHLYACGVLMSWSENRAGSGCHLGTFETARWYHVEAEVKMNSAMGKSDGILRIWVDGFQTLNDTTVILTNPKWRHKPEWREWSVGEQRRSADFDGTPDISEGGSIDESRYWDNVVFSTTRVGPGR